ncbi:MAG: exodeoxyribonuclease VII small subunit [Eubacteriales bacterium]|nr:exodeoxyribonuclease VII small subunit [Eubacteriales bacterium]
MPAKKRSSNLSMEDLLGEVNQIIEKLQSGELSFEENLEQYQKAMESLKECTRRVEKVEKELIVLEVDEL